MSLRWQDEILMVIPSINGGMLLRRMLPTLRFKPANVVVLDQGSTDETAEICAEAGVELVQLGRPHSYTEASNIGLRLGRDRGAKYVCISNNDITFQTDVLAEMHAEMARDPQLGIVAPSQVIIDAALDRTVLSQRAAWTLEDVAFVHEPQRAGREVRRLEADFCELTCALIRLSAIDRVGLLDDAFGFYHEDADLGFRLRQAGYNCAYLPQAQINHYASSTINREKLSRKAAFIARNRRYFASKHLGYGVRHVFDPRWTHHERGLLNRQLHAIMARYGLLDATAPELLIAPPGAASSGYLYTPSERIGDPARWQRRADGYQGVFAASSATRDLLAPHLGERVQLVPLGIDPDIFHPWLPSCRIHDATTYLAVLDGWQNRSLAVVIAAWRRFAAGGRDARLVLLGRGLIDHLGFVPDSLRRSGAMRIARHEAERIDVYEPDAPLRPEELAPFYRAVDFTIFGSCGEGLILPVLQSMACGVPSIFGAYGATAELGFPGALTFAPAEAGAAAATGAPAPDIEGLVARLEESFATSAAERAALAEAGLYRVRGQATLRHTAMALYAALSKLQPRDPGRFLARLDEQTQLADRPIGLPAGTPYRRMRQQLSSRTARRVSRIGHLAAQFGSLWSERGFRAAGRVTRSKLRYFLRHRAERIEELGRRALGGVRSHVSRRVRPLRGYAAPVPNSVLLIGYIDAQLGLGQSLRGLALALSHSAVRFRIYPFHVGVEGRRQGSYMPDRYDTRHAHAVNVIEVTPDELPTVFAHVPPSRFERSYNVLRSYWELSRAPESWRAQLQAVDEIWAPTSFVAQSFRTVFDGPISVIPPCVEARRVAIDGRARFGLEPDVFYFLFSFDYFSFPQRKNPLAVARAFRTAFPDPAARVGLVIKSSGAPEHYPDIREDLQIAAQYDGRVMILDEAVTRDEMLALIDAADCYLSLHRSEGFGLGMAEAMALGKPVIGTDYSGNTDFLNPQTGYPVPYRLTEVDAGEYVHAQGQVWASPSEQACAETMRHVFTARDEAAARARAARDFVTRRFGPAAVGRLVEQRLQQIFQTLAERPGSSGPHQPTQLPTQLLEHRGHAGIGPLQDRRDAARRRGRES